MIAPTIVLVSGPVAAGKSTLGRLLVARRGGQVFKTSDLIAERAERAGVTLVDRRDFQEFGDRLDTDSGGEWVSEDLSPRIHALLDRNVVVVDAVRIPDQVHAFRRAWGSRVFHVHVTAPTDELAVRYTARGGAGKAFTELSDYAQVTANTTESEIGRMADLADVEIDSGRVDATDVEIRVAAKLGLLAPVGRATVDVIIGGQYGSEGKGNIVFHLAPEYDVIVRSGGPNAGHKVPTSPVYTHTHLPSGTLAGDTRGRLVIAAGATIDPDRLLEEISDCGVSPARLTIDEKAFVITGADKTGEAAAGQRMGSTGSGTGLAAARRIGVDRLTAADVTRVTHIPELAPYVGDTRQVVQTQLDAGASVLVEGTQGASLSVLHGDWPHVTSRDTNSATLLGEVGLAPTTARRVILVVRSYPIRVGGPSGGLPREIDWDTIARRAGLDEDVLRDREVGSQTHRPRRVGEFSWTQLRRNAEINGVTDVALTFVDYLDARDGDANRFDQLAPTTQAFVEEVEAVTGARVSILSNRFGHGRGVIDRRQWRATRQLPEPEPNGAY